MGGAGRASSPDDMGSGDAAPTIAVCINFLGRASPSRGESISCLSKFGRQSRQPHEIQTLHPLVPRKPIIAPILNQTHSHRIVYDIFGHLLDVFFFSQGMIIKSPLPEPGRGSGDAAPTKPIHLVFRRAAVPGDLVLGSGDAAPTNVACINFVGRASSPAVLVRDLAGLADFFLEEMCCVALPTI